MDRRPGAHQARFWLEWGGDALACAQPHCGVGLGVAVADGAITGVALGAIAGVAFTFGVGCGVASCAGVPKGDADGFGVATGTGVGVGLAFDCMFIAFLSVSFPSGPKTI